MVLAISRKVRTVGYYHQRDTSLCIKKGGENAPPLKRRTFLAHNELGEGRTEARTYPKDVDSGR